MAAAAGGDSMPAAGLVSPTRGGTVGGGGVNPSPTKQWKQPTIAALLSPSKKTGHIRRVIPPVAAPPAATSAASSASNGSPARSGSTVSTAIDLSISEEMGVPAASPAPARKRRFNDSDPAATATATAPTSASIAFAARVSPSYSSSASASSSSSSSAAAAAVSPTAAASGTDAAPAPEVLPAEQFVSVEIRLPASEHVPVWWAHSYWADRSILRLYAFHRTLQQLYAQWIPHRAFVRRNPDLTSLSTALPPPLSAIEAVSEKAAAAAAAEKSLNQKEAANNDSVLASWLLHDRSIVEAITHAFCAARSRLAAVDAAPLPSPAAAATATATNGLSATKKRRVGGSAKPQPLQDEELQLCSALKDITGRELAAVQRVYQQTATAAAAAANGVNATDVKSPAAAAATAASDADAFAAEYKHLQSALDVYPNSFPATARLALEASAEAARAAALQRDSEIEPAWRGRRNVAQNALPPALAAALVELAEAKSQTDAAIAAHRKLVAASDSIPPLSGVAVAAAASAAAATGKKKTPAKAAAAAANGKSNGRSNGTASAAASVREAASSLFCSCAGGKCGADCACRSFTHSQYNEHGRLQWSQNAQRVTECNSKCSCVHNHESAASASAASSSAAAAAGATGTSASGKSDFTTAKSRSGRALKPARALGESAPAAAAAATAAAPLKTEATETAAADGSAAEDDTAAAAGEGAAYGTAARSAIKSSCSNRVVQHGPVGTGIQLEVFKTAKSGWGVRTLSRIPNHTYVCEYVGEVITDEVAETRGAPKDGDAYLWTIDLDEGERLRAAIHNPLIAWDRVKPFSIDAQHVGHVSRFVNHSCAPNLVAIQVYVESRDVRSSRIAFFSSKAIQPYTELTIDYYYEPDKDPANAIKCYCGAPACKGRLR